MPDDDNYVRRDVAKALLDAYGVGYTDGRRDDGGGSHRRYTNYDQLFQQAETLLRGIESQGWADLSGEQGRLLHDVLRDAWAGYRAGPRQADVDDKIKAIINLSVLLANVHGIDDSDMFEPMTHDSVVDEAHDDVNKSVEVKTLSLKLGESVVTITFT